MKLTLKSSLGEFQNLMGEGLGDHPEVLDLFRENTPFSHFLDVECIPPPLFLWQLIAREAKIKRKGEMWFVVKGVPVRYSLREFSLISGLNCSHLNVGFENSKELTSAKNDFIRAHFPSPKKGKKSAAVTYKMVVQRFLDIGKGLDREKKKQGQEMDAVKMATLLFVVVVLLGPADCDKSAILDKILGMIAQWTAVLGFSWGTWAFMESLGSLRKDLATKAKSIGRGASSTMYYTGFVLPIGIANLTVQESQYVISSADCSIGECVLVCSHSLGKNPKFMATAVDLGRELIRRRISFAYGGGNVGLQGAVASTVFNNGGLVRGFIPGYIATRRVYGPTYGIEHTISSNYYRYFEMDHAVEAFIVLPGGVDTMEGLFTLISWASEGLHNRPIGLLNIDGYFNNLIKFLDDAVRQNFMSLSQGKLFISSFFVGELLDKLEFAKAFPGPGALESILVPYKFEATVEWYLNFHPLETTTHPEWDAFVAKLEGRGEVHILMERKRKARNVPSPTRDNSVKRNEHISSPQASQRSQSFRESPSRVSHSNIPTPLSPTPHPTKPASNSFQELFDRMSKKIDDIAEEQRKRFEVLEKKVDALSTLINQKIVNKVLETTIMDNCEEIEARNPSSDDKDSPGLGILQILGEINQEHENPPSTLSDSVFSLENRMAESTHETMGTEAAASMKPLQEMVEPSHELMETDVVASMKPLQDKVVSPRKELGDEVEIIDALVYGKRLKKKSTSMKSPYTADGRKKKKADELLSKPPTNGDLLEFKSFIVEAIKTDRLIQCYLEQHKEHEEFVKTWWTDLITPGLWVADILYVLRRLLCNDDGDSVIAPFEFTTYVNSFACDPQWPVLSGPIEKIVDGTYNEGQEAFKTKAWKKNTKYIFYLKATGTHWFCVKADFERCYLVVLKSLSGISTNEDMHRLLKDELTGFKGIAGIKEIGQHGYADWDIELSLVPQQKDSNCGIFVVKMLELGAQHKDFKSLEKMTKEKMANMRLEIAYYICKEYHCRNKK
ncbi:unnamed protein product [Cuscuta campestris]|uniref:cytokinin riboside 5'-monophosphate phosphoribohydrolase n=1 Tax=Cuscuta campestris TaxID=132261 RepID=A0A484N6Y9_9ASTE|nr:unnamed protein product [Cuscuta campestris]